MVMRGGKHTAVEMGVLGAARGGESATRTATRRGGLQKCRVVGVMEVLGGGGRTAEERSVEGAARDDESATRSSTAACRPGVCERRAGRVPPLRGGHGPTGMY